MLSSIGNSDQIDQKGRNDRELHYPEQRETINQSPMSLVKQCTMQMCLHYLLKCYVHVRTFVENFLSVTTLKWISVAQYYLLAEDIQFK